MIAEIIPARRMPLALPVLDYLIPPEIERAIRIGQLVTIPFQQSQAFGVIFNIKKNPAKLTTKLRPIKSIVFDRPILDRAQLIFLKEISDFYKVSLGFLLKNNLPPLQKRKLGKLAISSEYSTIDKKDISKPTLEVYTHTEEREKLILNYLTKASGQTVLLVPEITALKKTKELLPPQLLSKTAVISSELSSKELFASWTEIWLGKKDIIIGTRRALFLPWFNLRQIILDDEGNGNYKSWDMAPRFHTRDAALFLSKNHGATLTLLSHSPSVESFFFAQKKVYESERLEVRPFTKPVRLVDMRTERRGKNFSLLSHDVFEGFKKVDTGDIFFFINRRGTVNYVMCRDCRYVCTCPTCKRSLTCYQKTGELRCQYCNYSEPMPLACPNCGGVDMSMFGAGTQLAEDLIRKIAGEKKDYSVARVDSDAADFSSLQKDGQKIVIGTQLAWQKVDWSRIKLLVFLDADISLFVPEYKITEQFWQQLRDAQFNLPSDCQIFIQTNHPEHAVFNNLFNPSGFYSEQLEERKLLGYPPFKFLLKLMAGYQTENLLKQETGKVMAALTNLTKHNPDITILGPLQSLPYYYKGRYWQVILIKLKYDNYKKNTNLILSQISDNWKVDPNPNSILSFT